MNTQIHLQINAKWVNNQMFHWTQLIYIIWIIFIWINIIFYILHVAKQLKDNEKEIKMLAIERFQFEDIH